MIRHCIVLYQNNKKTVQAKSVQPYSSWHQPTV